MAGLIGPRGAGRRRICPQLYFLVIIVANAISIGTLALVSRAIGAGNVKRAVDIARQSIIFSVIVAVVMMFLFLVFNREIISLAGFPVEIQGIAEIFLKIFTFALGPNYILIIASAVFRASGEVKKPLFAMALVSILNIAGDFILVFGYPPLPGLGYPGSRSPALYQLRRERSPASRCLPPGIGSHCTGAAGTSHWTRSRAITQIGWPAALLQMSWNFATIIIYNILSHLEGQNITALAALANGLRIEAVIYLPAFALNMAASVLVGQNLGAGRPGRAEKLAWITAWSGVAIMTTMALIVFIWAEFFASIVAKDSAVVAETVRYLRITMFSEPFLALSLVLGGGLAGGWRYAQHHVGDIHFHVADQAPPGLAALTQPGPRRRSGYGRPW